VSERLVAEELREAARHLAAAADAARARDGRAADHFERDAVSLLRLARIWSAFADPAAADSRAARARRAAELREQGLGHRDIARVMGLSLPTVRSLLYDPDGVRRAGRAARRLAA
jgi:hypothetical protein